jgi:transcriptional regulator with XRE-family HTH domain
MLSQIIKDQLNKKMAEQHYNLNSLALKSGLNPSSLRMFYSGAVKSPGIDTLYTLAEFLNCSLDELTGRRKFTPPVDKREFPWIGDLYKEIVDIVHLYIQEKKYEATLQQTSSFIKEAYIFALEKNKAKIDERFIKWIVDKNMDETLF